MLILAPFGGFLLFKANDDTTLYYRGGTAYFFLSSLWFSWLLSNHATRPFPNNNFVTDALMAWDGRVSRFHGYHELGSFDFDGFLLFKADDDTTDHCRGGIAICSSYHLCASHGCHQTMRHVHTQATALS